MSVGILGVNIVSEEPSSHTCDLRRAAAPTESTVAGSLAVQEKPTLALVHLTSRYWQPSGVIILLWPGSKSP